MKKLLFTVCALLSAATLRAAAPDSVQMRLAGFFKNLAAYDNQYTQEKVYLHLDNSAYFLNEKLWFKAYVTRASSLLPSEMSRVLYVELRDSYGNLMDRKNFKLEDGQANGNFDLGQLLTSGYYEVRAYTRAMLNWGDACVFSRVVPVYEVPKTDGNYRERLAMFDPSYNQQPVRLRPEAKVQNPKAEGQGDLSVAFFPEGGWRVKGLPSVVAFKAMDRRGDADYTEARLYDSAGKRVLTVQPAHAGMGSFLLDGKTTYARIAFTDSKGQEKNFSLPTPRDEGVTLRTAEEGDSLSLHFYATPRYRTRRLGLSVTCRGAAAYFTTLSIPTGEVVQRIARKVLHGGVNQITLFSDEGEVLAERLVWNTPQRQARLSVSQNEAHYSPFAPVVLNLELQNALKRPTEAYISLSVRDEQGDVNGEDDNLSASLLLFSDLRGYISHPEYYFQGNDDRRMAHLDLLLMVQGWRRYEWKQMAGVTPLKVVQPVEDGQLIRGQVLTQSRKPLPDASLSLLMATGNGQMVAVSTTDNDGNFAFLPKDYYGDGWGVITVRKNRQEQTCRILLDRSFTPSLRAFDPRELQSVPAAAAHEVPSSALFQWQDTIPKGNILLKEVTVKENRRTNFASGRFNWQGGEEAGRRASYIYYNIEEAAAEELDKGEDPPLLWDWLSEHNKDFDYFPVGNSSANEYQYKNRKATIVVDNMQRETDSETGENPVVDPHSLLLNEVKSVYISLNSTRAEALMGESNVERALILVYTYGNNDSQIEKRKKGTRVTRFQGYEPPVTFFSPDYRRIDAPDPKDYRRTLYWNPDVLTDTEGRASVLFYSNARENQRLHITARAVLPDGSLLDYDR